MSIQEQVTELQKVLTNLSGKDQDFASSLVKQWIMNNMLSDKQVTWVVKLTARATAPDEMAQDDLGNFGGVFDPHYDVDALHALRSRVDCLDERSES